MASISQKFKICMDYTGQDDSTVYFDMRLEPEEQPKRNGIAGFGGVHYSGPQDATVRFITENEKPIPRLWMDGEWKPFQKEKPMDRTEEIKALRAFVKDRGLGKNWLGKTVKKLRAGKAYETLTADQEALICILAKQGHILFEYDIRMHQAYCVVSSLFIQGVSYRVKSDYTLPDLTEETPPRFKKGTPLVFKPSGKVYIVADRTKVKPDDAPDDWCAFERVDGDKRWYTYDFCRLQELPPMPDKAKLERQGYRLTMKAADCRTPGHGNYFVDFGGQAVYSPGSHSYDPFNGWRWLVEKIEPKQESEETVEIIECDGQMISVNTSYFDVTLHDVPQGVPVRNTGTGMLTIDSLETTTLGQSAL